MCDHTRQPPPAAGESVSTDPKKAIELLQGLLVGTVTYDRTNPTHLLGIGASCQYVELFTLAGAE